MLNKHLAEAIFASDDFWAELALGRFQKSALLILPSGIVILVVKCICVAVYGY